MLYVLIVVLLVLAIAGGLPQWQVHGLGYYPSGLLTLVVVILVILLLMGRL